MIGDSLSKQFVLFGVSLRPPQAPTLNLGLLPFSTQLSKLVDNTRTSIQDGVVERASFFQGRGTILYIFSPSRGSLKALTLQISLLRF